MRYTNSMFEEIIVEEELTQISVTLNISTIILGCRNIEKGEAAKREILQSASKASMPHIDVWKVDLENFQSVVSFSQRVVNDLPRLDGFIANAGVSLKDFEMAEGYEKTLTINVVSTSLMARMVLPKLNATADRYGMSTNLSIVGSSVHVFAPHQQLQLPAGVDILQSLSASKSADMKSRYLLSKLLVLLCSRELAKSASRLSKGRPYGVVVNCVNPGWCRTPLFRYDDGGIGGRIGIRLIGNSSEVGSRAFVHAVTAGKETHGKYLSESRVKCESDFVRSKDGEDIQRILWEQLSTKLDQIVGRYSKTG